MPNAYPFLFSKALWAYLSIYHEPIISDRHSHSAMDAMHPPTPWVNATQLLEDARYHLSTGSQMLDSLLNGGLQEGHLTEVAGHSSSGKTQLCLQSAASVAFRHRASVTYVDTANSFSPRRVAHLIGPVDHQKFMNNIICHSVYDIFSLLELLHDLQFRLKSQVCDGDGRVRLLIVDSISSLIAPILGANGPQGHALMISTGSLLKKLAHEYNIAVLVTNHTVGGNQGSTKPALGDSWKSIPHTRLLLSRVCGSATCNVSVLKHPSVASTKAAEFTLHD